MTLPTTGSCLSNIVYDACAVEMNDVVDAIVQRAEPILLFIEYNTVLHGDHELGSLQPVQSSPGLLFKGSCSLEMTVPLPHLCKSQESQEDVQHTTGQSWLEPSTGQCSNEWQPCIQYSKPCQSQDLAAWQFCLRPSFLMFMHSICPCSIDLEMSGTEWNRQTSFVPLLFSGWAWNSPKSDHCMKTSPSENTQWKRIYIHFVRLGEWFYLSKLPAR